MLSWWEDGRYTTQSWFVGLQDQSLTPVFLRVSPLMSPCHFGLVRNVKSQTLCQIQLGLGPTAQTSIIIDDHVKWLSYMEAPTVHGVPFCHEWKHPQSMKCLFVMHGDSHSLWRAPSFGKLPYGARGRIHHSIQWITGIEYPQAKVCVTLASLILKACTQTLNLSNIALLERREKA